MTVPSYWNEMVSKVRHGYSVNLTKTLSFVSNNIVIPTPAGVTLTVNTSVIASALLHGHVKGSNLPTWSEVVSKGSPFKENAALQISMQPSFAALFIGTVGVDLRWLHSGVGVKATLVAELPTITNFTVEPDTGLHAKLDLSKWVCTFIVSNL